MRFAPALFPLLAVGSAIAASREASVSCPLSENLRGRENIEWSIGYGYGLTDKNQTLPRVLLVGDSICNAYQSQVRNALRGKMNVSYWVSSYCVTHPAYLRLLSFYLDQDRYDVIHINNGLHSIATPRKDWEKGLRAALALVRRKQPQARIVWATTTPYRKQESAVVELNAIAAKVVSAAGDIETDDLFSLLDPMDRVANWSDNAHLKPPAVKLQAQQVARICMEALASK